MSRILIVEDEVAIADLEKDYLELSGFEVEVENDGTSGLARALAEDFDLFPRPERCAAAQLRQRHADLSGPEESAEEEPGDQLRQGRVHRGQP